MSPRVRHYSCNSPRIRLGARREGAARRTARARTTSRDAPCDLRRGVVDVVDVVGSSKGRERGEAAPVNRPIDYIDYVDDIDDPRTEGRRGRVRPESGARPRTMPKSCPIRGPPP